ncbi:diguanylate cyclase domain-containing protein [Azospirillum thermophilum]|uniref:diguanylate cyclase domain-containing protein n=1 Tax=Azospirillum thermophilum TaxID=2202148 RepID=UPI00143D357F|nr:diguanylate cyclase [Azospirillum thermophilum]
MLSIALVVISIAFGLFIVLESTRRIDTASAERTRAEVDEALGELTRAMAKKAEEYSLWNDAVDNIVVRFDSNWVNANVGPYAERLWGLDRSYAWAGNDTLVYASQNGALRTDLGEAARENAELMALVALARARRDAFGGLIRIGRTLFIFGARIIEYEEGRAPLPPNPDRPVQVFLVSLDKELTKVAGSRRIGDLRFVAGGEDERKRLEAGRGAAGLSAPDHLAALPLRDMAGQPLGHLTWTPEQPGRTLVRDTAPYGAVFVLALAALFLTMLRVLLDLKRQEPLRLSEARLAQAQRVARLAYTVHLPEDELEVSENLGDILGLPAGASPTTAGTFLDRVTPRHRAEVQEAYRQSWAENRRFEIEFAVTAWDGRTLYLKEVGQPFHDAGGLVLGLITAIQDVTERKQAEELIRHQATYDALTDLPNRTLFYDRLQQAIRRAVRCHQRMALLFLDLDRFKWVNDSFGHRIGDLLLREAAHRMASCIRDSETVARIGGDEFTVILSEIRDDAEVEAVARRLLEHLEEPFLIAGQTLHISASIGITFAPDHGTDLQQLVKNADMAMYQAKRQGRGGWRFYSPEFDAGSLAS